MQDYAIRLVLATHPQGEFAAAATNQYIRCGASPRGAQALVLAAKVRALLDGRFNVSFEDIRRVYLPALRHRILLNFEAQAENIASDTVLAQILNEVKEKAAEMPVPCGMNRIARPSKGRSLANAGKINSCSRPSEL